MGKWGTVGQDFAASASAALVVTALTGNLSRWPSGQLDQVVTILFAVVSVVFLVKLVAAISATEPRKHYKFRRPRDHRPLDDAWVLGWLMRTCKLDASAAKTRMNSRIRKWMLRELDNCSSAVIFTRDLSWADPTDESLSRLARGGDLRIVSCTVSHSPSQRVELAQFRRMGAQVDHWKNEAPARFTIFKKDGKCRVAVALPDKKHHLIVVSEHVDDGLYRLAMGVLTAIDGPKVRGLPDD